MSNCLNTKCDCVAVSPTLRTGSLGDPMFLVSVSSIPPLKHLQSPPLRERLVEEQRNIFSSFISQQNGFYLSKKKLKRGIPLQARVIWSSYCEMCSDRSSRHNCIRSCFAVWLNTPCSRPVEDVLWCMLLRWLLIYPDRLSPIIFPLLQGPAGPKGEKVFLAIASFLDESVLCMDVFLRLPRLPSHIQVFTACSSNEL